MMEIKIYSFYYKESRLYIGEIRKVFSTGLNLSIEGEYG